MSSPPIELSVRNYVHEKAGFSYFPLDGDDNDLQGITVKRQTAVILSNRQRKLLFDGFSENVSAELLVGLQISSCR
jgi:hypothetical protein